VTGVSAEYRIDQETGDWDIVAPERAARPVDLGAPGDGSCPFCPGHESRTPPEVLRVPAGPEQPWRVRVVPNAYAIVGPAVPGDGPDAATGRHEVVVESPQHDGDLRFAGAVQVGEVLRAMRERCRAMTAGGAAAVVVFRNHGAAAGTSLRHPHSQIVALDRVPPGLARRWDRCRAHLARTGRRLHDDLAAAERDAGVRVVAETGGLLVYQPWAAGVSHQTVLLPADTSADLAGASDAALDAVAGMLPRVAAALAVVRDDPAYNLVVHAGPAGDPDAARWYRWHVTLYPRVSRRAGLEFATGLGVNPSVPERTAPLLRAALTGTR
jgi:UDPglucose--hexose-1-phosphate uridylyltransferase